jgi:hypothetical protein
MSARSRAFPWFGTPGVRTNPGLPALLVAGAQAAARPAFVVPPMGTTAFWRQLAARHRGPYTLLDANGDPVAGDFAADAARR